MTVNVPAGPAKPLPTPSNEFPTAGAAAAPGDDCSAVSGAPVATGAGRMENSRLTVNGPVAGRIALIELSGSETSRWASTRESLERCPCRSGRPSSAPAADVSWAPASSVSDPMTIPTTAWRRVTPSFIPRAPPVDAYFRRSVGLWTRNY